MAFDVKRLEVYGPRVPVIQGVRRSPGGVNGAAGFSVSDTGSLAYIPGPLVSTLSHLARAERKGGAELLKLPPGNYFTPRVSPDGGRIAFGIDDGKEAIVYTYASPTKVRWGDSRMEGTTVFRSGLTTVSAWRFSPIGKATSGSSGRPSSAAKRNDSRTPNRAHRMFQSPGPRKAMRSVQRHPGIRRVVAKVLADRQEDLAFDGVRSTNPTDAVFSPDGRWVAYAVTRRIRTTIFVQPYPETGRQVQLVAKGSDNPHEAVWSPRGNELFFTPAPGRFESVSVTTSPRFTFGNAVPEMRQLTMTGSSGIRGYDITPSGQFVGLVRAATRDWCTPRRRFCSCSTGMKS